VSNPDLTNLNPSTDALARALRDGLPLVAVLGQATGWTPDSPDPVLLRALEKAQREGNSWSELLGNDPLEGEFYQWLSERFLRRSAPQALQAIADMPLSAVFTSSIDPGLINLVSTKGREPDPILLGSPVPSELRSTRRPPLFYLFGRCGVGPDLAPPISRQALNKHQFNHASAMLRNLTDCATSLGLILIDGFTGKDWLKPENLLAALSNAPKDGVIWFGPDPSFERNDLEQFLELVSSGIILREQIPLGEVYAFLRASELVPEAETWDDPELISLPGGKSLVVSPKLRLITEAAASIIDNSWTGFIAPLPAAHKAAAFQRFHGANLGTRALIEGIQRRFSFERDFESVLRNKVDKALQRHSDQQGALILHGQSGVGKTISLGRLAIHARSQNVPVLMVTNGTIPQPNEITTFLETAGQAGAVTLLLIDANNGHQRYDEFLAALRSRGNKAVVVGTSYRSNEKGWRWTLAPSDLSKREQKFLRSLSSEYHPNAPVLNSATEHALAKFYWSLPDSRAGMAEGLSLEARYLETELRLRETRPKKKTELSNLALALVAAGYGESSGRLLDVEGARDDLSLDSPAAKLIDYVMVVSRVYKAVPVNLLVRTVLLTKDSNVDIEAIRDLFVGEDMFRWREGGRDQSEMVIQARLQIEAELVCNRRLGTSTAEASRVLDLLANAHRVGIDGSEDAHFATDIVYALGPDGPAGERYRDSYLEIARCLTTLREKYGARNARLMLQESTLRRAYIKTHEPSPEETAIILREAMRAVDEAVEAVDLSNPRPLYAAKRTREYLLTERAATYGYLATDSARSGNPEEVWAMYRTAKVAALLAAGKNLGYQPLDVALWIPIRVLKADKSLSEIQRIELKADLRATLDKVTATSIPPDQIENFERQRLQAAEALGDEKLSDSAFAALDAAGSPAGYYIRARRLAPDRPKRGATASPSEIAAAKKSSEYLTRYFPKISSDPRSLHLLFSMEWLQATGCWVFRGLRQPLPHDQEHRVRLRKLVSDISYIENEAFSTQYRYIDAVLSWLTGSKDHALQVWRDLARDTEYIEDKRIINRNSITDSSGKAVVFSGVVIKSIGSARWAVKVNGSDFEVDLQEADFSTYDVHIGREVKNFAISFNYRGPIADPFYTGGH
jgi:hypothetical protein